MTRLTFRFSPLDAVDFDVCAGPTRPSRVPPEPPQVEPEAATTGPAASRPEPAPTAKG
jgi:hypothetical protein